MLLAIAVCAIAIEPPAPIDFAHDVLPVLKARCAECHTNGKYKGSFSLDTRGDLLRSNNAIPGKAADSEFMQRISSDDPDYRMPPKGARLTSAEIDRLRRWIDGGMAWQEGFSFKSSAYVAPLKPRRPAALAARPGLDHPIDLRLSAYWAKRNLPTPRPADDVAFARRMFLDVIGQLPTPEEVAAFIADSSPNKRAALARRLLGEDRNFTEHWLTFWNDLLRNDYAGTGYIDGGRQQITAWLYHSLMENKPYDVFVRELIAPAKASEGFANGITWRGNVNASQVRELQFAQNAAQVFFGVNLKCASCHDSFIDNWKLDDAYSLAAVVADHPLELHRCDKPQGRNASPRFLWPELGAIDATLPRTKRQEQLANLVTATDNGRFARTIVNRVWDRLFGRGLVHPVDVMAGRPWDDDLLDELAVWFTDHGCDVKALLLHMTSSRAYQAQAATDTGGPADEFVFHGPLLKRLTAEQFTDAVWQITGTAPEKAAAKVALPAFMASVPTNRRKLRASLVNADALMRSLGRPNREQVVTTRPNHLTTLQALDLSNGPILAQRLSHGAQRLMETKLPAGEVIDTIYRMALGRSPTPAEHVSAMRLVGESPTADSVADLLWIVVMLPEFQLVR